MPPRQSVAGAEHLMLTPPGSVPRPPSGWQPTKRRFAPRIPCEWLCRSIHNSTRRDGFFQKSATFLKDFRVSCGITTGRAAMATKGDSTATRAGTDDLLPTRRSLIGRLKNWEDDGSWQEFFDVYWRLIYRVAVKSGLTPLEAEEVVQDTVLSVAKAMKDFRYDPRRASFKGWLLQLTGWRITDQFRRRAKRPPGDNPAPDTEEPKEGTTRPDAEPLVDAGLERIWESEWEENLMRAGLERVRPHVNPKHLQIFDLYVLKGQTAAEVGKFLGVSKTEVYLAKYRVAKLLRKEVDLLREQIR